VGAPLQVPIPGISSLAEGVLFLRFVEVEATVRRVASVAKIRDSDFDPRLHAYVITDNGYRALGPYRQYEEILGGLAQSRTAPPADPSSDGT